MKIIPLSFFNLVLTYAKESEHLAAFVFFFSDHLLIILTFLIMHYMLENKFSTAKLKKKSFLFSYLLPFANTYFGRSIVNVDNNVLPLYDVGYGG